jgi:hypothetical protein
MGLKTLIYPAICSTVVLMQYSSDTSITSSAYKLVRTVIYHTFTGYAKVLYCMVWYYCSGDANRITTGNTAHGSQDSSSYNNTLKLKLYSCLQYLR